MVSLEAPQFGSSWFGSRAPQMGTRVKEPVGAVFISYAVERHTCCLVSGFLPNCH